MLWDCFLFSGELDMLECRLTEMESLDCKFVISEAPVTFQGQQKPLHFEENKERFAPWAERIVYIPSWLYAASPWEREYEQRDILIGAALKTAAPEDHILFGDVDEIPRSDIKFSAETALGMRHHLFAIDWVHPDPWYGSVVHSAGFLQHMHANRPVSGRWLRDQRWAYPVIQDAGWHLSWFGGARAAKEKAHSFSHTEFTGKVCQWLFEGHCYSDGLVWDDNQELRIQQARASISSAPRWVREGRCPDSWFRWGPEE
jgi:beta-1,4-mannosyl-glycoprotein beta-1,4-N-acetylglucosaminyltransferase